MKSWKRTWLGLVLIVAVTGIVGLLASCGTDDTATTVAPEGTTTTAAASDLAPEQTLIYNIMSEPPSLDPNLATDTSSMKIVNSNFEGLMYLNPDGTVSPGAAESYKMSADGLTYTFQLRGTDKWTNGDTVTSADFKASWLRMLDPATAADYAYQLFFIKGAEEFNTEKGTADEVGIDATDPKTLVVTLKAPTPWFPNMTTLNMYFPIPEKVVKEFGDKWTEPANIVTNGAYKLTSWTHDSEVTLEKWDGWRDAANVTLTSVKFVMINEATTAVAAFETGELDITSDLPVADMDRLKTLPEYKVFPMLGTYYMGYNVEKAPLDKPDVRKALALAIDRQSIVDNVTKGGQIPATGFISKGMPGFDTIQKDFIKPTAQVDQAKELLASAGFPEGKGLPEIVIYYNTSEAHQAICEAIQEQWKAIGVNSTLKNMEWKQFIEFRHSDPSVMVFRSGWVADYNDPYNYFDVFRGGGGNNDTRWKNATFDANLEKALAATSEADRNAIYSEMEDILSVQDMPYAPVYWYTNPELVKSYVSGYEPNALGETIYFKDVKILKH